MEPLLIIVLLASFFISFLAMPFWINKASKIGLLWEDMNKFGNPRNVAGSGGLMMILGFILAVLFYIAIQTFYYQYNNHMVEIFALISVILILAMIGIVDDLLGWHHGGLSKKLRVVLCLFASIPLIAINAGHSSIDLGIFGLINLGVIYTIVFIPLAIVGTATTFNFLAGFNGLEASQGILILGGLSFVAFFTGNSWLALIGLCMAAALTGFWIYNKNPAKSFPGDVLTYPVGGMIGIMAILGNFEKVALFFFIPYIIEVLLKLRGGLKKQSFGMPNKDGSLEMPYKKIYGLTHLAILIIKKIKNKAYETDVVRFLNLFELIVIILGFLLFRNSIF